MPDNITSTPTTPPTGEKQITVVGLRHYIKGGEEGLPAFFDSHPIGSELMLQRQGPGSKFPGAIAALDPEGLACIGMISTDDLHVANCYVPTDDYAAISFARIVAHEAKALTIAIPDLTTADTKPEMRRIAELRNEPVIEYTTQDNYLQRVSSLLMGVKAEAQAIALLPYYRQFVDDCHLSDATEIQHARSAIGRRLSKMTDTRLRQLGRELTEKHKDLRRGSDIGRHCEEHYRSICYIAQGQDYSPEARQMLDLYEAQLRYHSQDRPVSQQVWVSESQRLRHLIDNDLRGKFAAQRGQWQALGKTIHYAAFDLRSLYVLYSRMLQLDYADSHIDRQQLAAADATTAAFTPQHPNTLTPSHPNTLTPSHPPQQLISEVIEIVTHFMAHCPSSSEIYLRGMVETVEVHLLTDVLNEWLKALSLGLHPAIEAYARVATRLDTHQLRKAASYELVGWVMRHTKCFGQIQRKQAARIMASRQGCRSTAASIECFLVKKKPTIAMPAALTSALTEWFAAHLT